MRPTYGGALQAEGRLRGWSPARLLRSGCHRLSSRILTAVCAPRHCAVSVLAHAPGICVANVFSPRWGVSAFSSRVLGNTDAHLDDLHFLSRFTSVFCGVWGLVKKPLPTPRSHIFS